MADRLFASFLLIVTLAYAYIAWTLIQAPFQYDPLGPESWPRILAGAAIPCILYILWRPDAESFAVTKYTWFRIALMVVLLFAYAELYEPLGFIISTILFGTIVALTLGAPRLGALAFGLGVGVFGYLLCFTLMGLNLPEGETVKAALEFFRGDAE
ncbi:MAG: membrane protein [Roseovarius sp. BRH_c41]|uniref:tripartite tricarboxylate transporter TctB family protein n=1 Tax=Roseovarius sp. BRH_c41 TaxID=1629709 RepID=UPI0005F1CAD8|nr:tripartite tricarboxylate transporter TctB family protein [Roseovarius sp. BRH_c41]KJS41862.1 MAG: membrane protein [Roseovarius sp. BRH_c41]